MTDSTDTTIVADAAAEPLEKLGLTRGHSAVVGMQWGDEGKGQIVDMLTERFDLIVRYNGGNNAGHSVHIGDQKFALHLLPSGIMYPDKINVVGNGVVVDPVGIRKEIHSLTQRGITIGDNLRISDRAHVVFPYHKFQDTLLDKALAASAGDERKIGTTGRGIGPCYADKALRSTGIRIGELLDPERLRKRLVHIVELKNLFLGALAAKLGETFQPYQADALAEEFIEHGKALRPHICDTTALLGRAVADRKLLLFEGANANLLDIDHGTYPFVTSSNCSSLGIYAGSGVPGGTLSNVVGIVKLYTSRVGGGPFPTELEGEQAQQIRNTGNEFGTTTGRPRRVGWLDLVAMRYTSALSGATAWACTGLSVLRGVKPLKVCVGYLLDGQPLDHFPADVHMLERVEPVYETLDGFDEPVDGCESYEQLPAAAKAYVTFIEKFVGVPIRMVCVGRKRDQILVREPQLS